MEALRPATTGPAEFFGLEGSLGTVGAGKSVDLVLLDGNPLQDIRSTVRIAAPLGYRDSSRSASSSASASRSSIAGVDRFMQYVDV